MKGGVHCVYVFGAWGNHIQCHKEETGRSQPLSKQAGAEQLRLLTAELWIYRKTWAAVLPQWQRDNNMKNSPIWSRRLSLSRWIPFRLINVSMPSPAKRYSTNCRGFSIPDVIECVFFMRLQWPLIKRIKGSTLIVGQVRKPTCSNQLDDKQWTKLQLGELQLFIILNWKLHIYVTAQVNYWLNIFTTDGCRWRATNHRARCTH